MSSLLISCLFAMLAVLPITFLQYYFSFLLPASNNSAQFTVFLLFAKVVIFNGIIEELFKTLFIALIPAKKIKFRHFFICSLLFGLCLGAFESSVYFLNNIQNANNRGAQLIYEMVFARIFTSDLVHMMCAGLCGIFIWSARTKKIDILAILFAIFAHTAYDFFCSFNGEGRWFGLAAILFVIVECRVHYQKFAGKKDSSSEENETIIVFQQNEEPGEKRKKLSSSAVVISETNPEEAKKAKKTSSKKSDPHNDKTITGVPLK